MMTLQNNRTPHLHQALCIISKPSVNSNWSQDPEMLNLGQHCFFVLCDLEIWQITLKNNTASLLCYFNLSASFHSHRPLQAGVTVRKCPIRVAIVILFLSRVTLKFDGWPWKMKGHLFHASSSFVQNFIAICEFKMSYSPETNKLGFDLCDLDIWPMTGTFCMDITSVNGDSSWKFHDDTMMKHSRKGVTDVQTDGRSDWTNYRATSSQLKTIKWGKFNLNCFVTVRSWLVFEKARVYMVPTQLPVECYKRCCRRSGKEYLGRYRSYPWPRSPGKSR